MNEIQKVPGPQKTFLATLWRGLGTRQEIACGITRFRSVRFFVVLSFYLVSMVLLARDAFFFRYGEFAWNQPIFVILLSCMITATVNWELLVTGKPEGANLFLQFVLFVPMTIFIARVLGDPAAVDGPQSFWGEMAAKGRDVLEAMLPPTLSRLVEWASAVFRNIWLILLFVILEVALSLKSRSYKMAVLMLFVVTVVGHALSDGRQIHFFLLGALALFAGFAFHYCDYSKLAFHENLIRRLPQKEDAAVFQAILRIMNGIYQRGEIEERAFLQIVKSVYSDVGRFTGSEIRMIAAEINRKMLYEYSLITIKATSSGYYAMAEPRLYQCASVLQMGAVLPRAAVIAVLTLLWLASPVDLIPDALPFGGLDDVLIGLLSTFVLRKSWTETRGCEENRQA